MDRLERLTNLLLVLLDARGPLTLQEIVHTVEGYPPGHDAYRQAFERDKRILREQGIVVTVEPVAGADQVGYRIRPEDYYLGDLGLTPDEQEALNLAVAAVSVGGAGEVEAGWRLGVHAGEAAFAELPSLPALPALYEAVRTRAPVTFRYRSARRRMDPFGLAFRRGAWYLMGRDHDRDALRSFRVDRIEGAPSLGTPGSFTPPVGFDPRQEAPGDPWAIGQGDVVEASVRVDRVHAPLVVAELGEASVSERGDDGSVVVTLPVANIDGFRTWVLGLLHHAEVLGPPEVRDHVVSWLRSMARAAA